MNLKQKMLSIITNTTFFQNGLLMRRHFIELKHIKLTITDYWNVYRILNQIPYANHSKIQYISNFLIKKSHYIGYFYLAQSLALQNKVQEAIVNLEKFLEIEPYHTDASILLSELEFEQGKIKSARNRLYTLLNHSKRRKVWQALSNMVNNKEDFNNFLFEFTKKFPNFQNELILHDLANHLSNAAVRANENEFALNFWQNQYLLSCATKTQITRTKINFQRKFNDKDAAIALSAIKNCLDKHEVPFFLISGTLLGCIRENKLLNHDKDIDIGVWDLYSVNQLSKIIKNSGCFYILPIYSKDILVIRHVNGVSIDIFIHYKSQNDYWHAGRKCSWHNSPFELSEYFFLGNSYLIPTNYDLYLSENYGHNWRVPQINFDSALDTPNMRILSKLDFLIYLYKRVLSLSVDSETRKKLVKKIEIITK